MADIAKSYKYKQILSSFLSPSSLPFRLNKIKDTIWPIENHELPKFLFITSLMFSILCIQNLIRALKDSIINTMIGTETITFLKFGGVLPSAFLFTLAYVKLVGVMKSENIFYLIMSCFLSFFALFAFIIFPNHEYLHLGKDQASYLINLYPNFKWVILLLSNWSFSLFYIIAELWPNAVFALLFWQFVNNITSVEDSKRFFPLFGLLGQTGLYISGTFLSHLSAINNFISNYFNLKSSSDVISVQLILSIVVFFGILGLISFWVINNKILDKAQVEALRYKVKGEKLSLLQSVKMVLSSRYIMLITILLICYGIAINLVEGPWKASVAKIYTSPTDFAAFVGSYLKYTGIFTILFVILGSNIVRKLGWFSAAIITPFMVFTTGLLFFLVANFDFMPLLSGYLFLATDPLMFAITLGAIQNVLSKSSKYTLFDSTKEMAYVPLEGELKTKGKAAADVIGTKLGKSASALLQSMIFTLFPAATYQSISPYLMVVFGIICIVWIWAVVELNKEYKAITSNT